MMNSIFSFESYFFNPFAIPYLVVGCLIAFEGLYIFSQSKKTTAPVVYFLFTVASAAWLIGVASILSSANETAADFWSRRLSWFGIIFVTPAVYHFSVAWNARFSVRSKRFIYLNYLTALVFYLICIFSTLLVDGVYAYRTGYFPKAGPLEAVFIVWFYSLMTLSFRNFAWSARSAPSVSERKLARVMIVAFAMGFLGSIEFVPNYGIYVFPIAYFPMLLYTTLMGYCVIAYKLMDIETVIHRTFMWVASTLVALLPFIVIIHRSHEWIAALPKLGSTLFQLLLLVAFYFYYRALQPRLDALFRRRSANLQNALNRFSQDLVHLKNIRELLQGLARLMRRALYTRRVSVFLRDENSNSYVPAIVKGARGLKPVPAGHPFIAWMEKRDEVVRGDLAVSDPEVLSFREEVERYFEAVQAQIAVPFVLGGRLIGIVHLGKKENLKRYNGEEVAFLSQLKYPVTIAFSNSMQYESVSELYKQVQHQNERLKELDRLKSEFLANTSHELRTPLNGILGLVEAILEGADGAVTTKQQKHLKMIVESGTNLKELINNLLELSRLESGKQTLNRKVFNVLNVVDAVISLLQGIAIKKGITLSRTVSEPVSDIDGDPEKIQRVLMNLVGNALKFTREGSVTVIVTEMADAVRIGVKDTGIGISAEGQAVIFDRFRQADGSTTREFEGTGLGLAIVKEIVELHGGSTGVESELGKGTHLYFDLPKRAGAASIPEAGRRPADGAGRGGAVEDSIRPEAAKNVSYGLTEDPEFREAVRGSGEKILIIDDNAINREVVRVHLELNGYHVIEAPDGIRGLEMMKEQQPELILLDLMMPRMSGYEFCERLRKDHSSGEVPVIMLTAKTEMGDKVQGLSLGANDFISKPFDKEELLARVGVLLKIRHMTRELKEWNEQLEVKVDERTKELARTQEQLVQAEKLATIGTLAGGVAHEINNPLTAVLTNAQILKMTAASDDLESIELIEEGAKRCQTIIQKLLKYARKVPSEAAEEMVDLVKVVRSAVSMVSYQMTQDNIAIELETHPVPGVRGVGNEIEQVVTNLVLNARDAIRDMGREGRIGIRTYEKKGAACLEVEDNGKGIEKENLKKIFDPFFTTKDVGKGTGLGLAVSYSILEKHGCKVQVESEPGKGTTFRLRFPAVSEADRKKGSLKGRSPEAEGKSSQAGS